MEDNGGMRFFYFLAGLGMGALMGVLFAPSAGERTREMIAGKAGESREYLLRKGREVRDQAAGYTERSKEVLTTERDHLAAAVEAGKQAYRAESQPKDTSE